MTTKLTPSIIAKQLLILNETTLIEIGASCYTIVGKFNPEDLLLPLDLFEKRYLRTISKTLIKNLYKQLPAPIIIYSRHSPKLSNNEVSESLEYNNGLMLCVRVSIYDNSLIVKFSNWSRGLYDIQVKRTEYKNGEDEEGGLGW